MYCKGMSTNFGQKIKLHFIKTSKCACKHKDVFLFTAFICVGCVCGLSQMALEFCPVVILASTHGTNVDILYNSGGKDIWQSFTPDCRSPPPFSNPSFLALAARSPVRRIYIFKTLTA